MDRSTYGAYYMDSEGGWDEFSVNSPNFHSLIARGDLLPVNDYRWRRFDWVHPRQHTSAGLKTVRQTLNVETMNETFQSGTFGYGSGVVQIEGRGFLETRVRNELLKRIKDADVNLGVAMGESLKTADFISSSMVKVVRSYQLLKRGRVSESLRTLTGAHQRDWRDIPGALSNNWLAYSYGLKPLLNDVYGACKALEKSWRPRVPIKTVSCSFSRSYDLWQQISPPNGLYHTLGSGRARGEVQFVVENPLIRTLDQVGLTNPLSVAWELVPFSFVVDWFIPVGNFIDNIQPPQGVDFVRGWISSTATGATDVWWWSSSGSGPVLLYGRAQALCKNRTILTAFPRYQVLPASDFLSSKQKVTSALALLTQTLIR